MEIFKKIHWIQNLPEDYSFVEKIYANFIYLCTNITLSYKKSSLNPCDCAKTRTLLKKGDIVLLGNRRKSSRFFIKGILTHAALCVNKRKFIHALANGVCFMSLKKLFREYDALIILRIPKRTKKRKRILSKVIKFARKHIGFPYDFKFSNRKDRFFCTNFINFSYKHAGYDTRLFSLPRDLDSFFKKFMHSRKGILHAEDFLKGKFNVIFVSHNLKIDKKKVFFNEVN